MIKHSNKRKRTSCNIYFRWQWQAEICIPDLSSSSIIGEGSYGTTVYEYVWNETNIAVKKIKKAQNVHYQKEIEVLQTRLKSQSPYLIQYFTHAEDSRFW